MTNSEARKFVEAVYRDIWAGKDLTKFDKYYSKDLEATAYLPNEELFWDYAALKKFAHERAKACYKVETILEEVIAHKNKIIVKYKQKSVNRTSGKVMHIRVAFEYEMESDKIHKCWAISSSIWNW